VVILLQVLADLVNGWLLYSNNQPDYSLGSGGGAVSGSSRSRQRRIHANADQGKSYKREI